MLRGVPCKRPSKRSLAHAHQNVVPIDKLPRHVAGLPEAQLIAWIQEATQLTIHQLVTRPSLVHERLLAALKRERRAARKRAHR
jgi:hypothetical protein